MVKKIGKSNFSNIAPVVIHHYGDPKEIEFEGEKFYRQETITPESYGYPIPCAQYDNHFIFYDTRHMGSTLLCTCGGPAVIVNPSVYKRDATPDPKGKPEMLVCWRHMATGRHYDGTT